MMRLSLCLALVFCLIFPSVSMASDIDDKEYTDIPGTPTQDSVVGVVTLEGEDIIVPEEPDEKSMAVLTDMFKYVMLDNGRPATYFLPEVQQEIKAVLPSGVNIEALHMSEFSLMSVGNTQLSSVTVDETLSVDYSVGQLVVVLIGQYPDGGSLADDAPLNQQIKWTPINGTVVRNGVIEYRIPDALFAEIKGDQVLVAIMTNRYNTRTVVDTHEREVITMLEFPSKAAINLTKIEHYQTSTTVVVEDDFEILIVEENERISREIADMRTFVVEEEQPVFNYFDAETQNEASLLLPEGTDVSSLIGYEMVALKSVNYKDTYGDVEADITFPTQFPDGSVVVAFIGVPMPGVDVNGDGLDDFEWHALRASISGGYAKVTFSQQALIYMSNVDALLMIVGENQVIVTVQ